MRIAPIALTASLTVAAPALAQPVELPKGWVNFAEVATQIVLQTAVSAVRSQVELTYDDIVLDLAAGRMAMTGLDVRPTLPWAAPGDCVAGADAIEIFAPAHLDISKGRIEIVGLDLPLACLPPDPQGMILAAGYESLRATSLAIDFDYHSGSSALDLTVSGTVEDAVAFEAAMEFAYFWVQTPGVFDDQGGDEFAGPPQGEPVADLEFAEIALSDIGLLERAGPMLGAMIGGFESVPPMVEGVILQELGADGQTFAVEMRGAVEGFLAGESQMVITIAPDEPVRLTPDLADDPQVLFAALAPRASGKVAASTALIERALLEAALSGGDLTEADRLEVGEALATGVGAPRAPEFARQVLAPLVLANHPEAALITSESFGREDPVEAYKMAIIAAAGGAEGGLARMDRLEARLSYFDVSEAQVAVAEGWPYDEASDPLINGDVAAIRAHAGELDRGVGAPRNYADAYLYATLAAAGGDRGAGALMDRIDARMSRRGAGSDGWAADRMTASTAALQIWTEDGLLDRLSE